MLVVTSTERVLHGILRHTPDLWPAVALHGVLVVGPPGLEQGLVRAAAPGNDSHLRPHSGCDGLLPPRGEAEAGRALVLVVRYHDREAPRAPGEGAAIAHARLNVAYDGPLRDLLQRQDVPDGERRLLPAVHELAGVHPLCCHHELHVALEAVRVEELDLGHGCAAAGVVEDLLDDAADVPTALGVVDGSKLHGPLASAHVRLEDGGLSLTLGLSTSSRNGVRGVKPIELVMHYPSYRKIIDEWHRIVVWVGDSSQGGEVDPFAKAPRHIMAMIKDNDQLSFVVVKHHRFGPTTCGGVRCQGDGKGAESRIEIEGGRERKDYST